MKNMKVAMKLTVSFVIIIILAIAVGLVGIYAMSSINAGDDSLYNSNVVAISAMGEVRELLQQERIAIRDYVLNAGDAAKINEIRNTIAGYEKAIAEEMAIYENTITDESAENDYYAAKNTYLNDFSRIKQEIMQESLISFEAGLARLTDPVVSATTTGMTQGFKTSMINNDTWAHDTVTANTALYHFMTWVEVIIIAITVIISIFLAMYLSGLISKPLNLLSKFMIKAGSTGDLEMSSEDHAVMERYSETRDEIGQLIKSSTMFINRVVEVSEELETVSNGDLSISIPLLSPSDIMGNSIKKMLDNLNNMFSEIHTATAQVASGSSQIADGASALAQGSTEQAATVEELSASISEIAQKTKTNSEMASRAASLASDIMNSAEKGSAQMNEMMSAVNEISQASQNISKVIKVIEDIAFQTNILALNAAVEAARAGQHGKGFAVVAEEVRNLAAKSAEAARDTGGLIANSIEKSELGAKIANETSESFTEIVSEINESNVITLEIAKSSEEQAVGIAQINDGIDQVTQVVQQNSATAEQSAAASQELNSQSDYLEQMISRFKLRDSNNFLQQPSSRQVQMIGETKSANGGNWDSGKY